MSRKIQAKSYALTEVCMLYQSERRLRFKESCLQRFFACAQRATYAAATKQYAYYAAVHSLENAAKTEFIDVNPRFFLDLPDSPSFERLAELNLSAGHFPATLRRTNEKNTASKIGGDNRCANDVTRRASPTEGLVPLGHHPPPSLLAVALKSGKPVYPTGVQYKAHIIVKRQNVRFRGCPAPHTSDVTDTRNGRMFMILIAI